MVSRPGRAAAEAEAAAAGDRAEEGPPPVEKLLHVDVLELEIGYLLVRLVDLNERGLAEVVVHGGGERRR